MPISPLIILYKLKWTILEGDYNGIYELVESFI
jgi:hypothetical protein